MVLYQNEPTYYRSNAVSIETYQRITKYQSIVKDIARILQYCKHNIRVLEYAFQKHLKITTLIVNKPNQTKTNQNKKKRNRTKQNKIK